MNTDVRIHSHPRAIGGDDALGEQLAAAVRSAHSRGGAPPAVFCATASFVHVIPLRPFVEARIGFPGVIASLTQDPPIGVEAPEVVGMIGTFMRHQTPGDAGIPVAIVFAEWTDGRWWHWRANPHGERPDDGAAPPLVDVDVLRAVDGLARPVGLGGWWTLARRTRVRARWTRSEPVIVH